MNIHDYAKRFLSEMARRVISKYNPKIIAITGSIGKTSTKEAVVAVVGGSFSVFATPKNYNNEYGVPLTVLGVKEPPGRSIRAWCCLFLRCARLLLLRDKAFPKFLILEMGADNPGDIARLLDIAPPDFGVLTNIGPSHLEKFGTIEKIIREKKLIVTAAIKKQGVAIVNADNEHIVKFIKEVNGTIRTFGFSESAEVRAVMSDVEMDDLDICFKLLYQGSAVPVHLKNRLGRSVVYASLAAVAVGLSLEIPLLDCVGRLSSINWPSGRMTLRSAISGALIIDDTYNASVESTRSALDGLVSLKKNHTRVIAVLGSMFELGSYEKRGHEEIGEYVAGCGIDFLICVGSGGRVIGQSAQAHGMDIHSIMYVNTSNQAGVALRELIVEGDVVLVKGSRGMMMERAVAMMVESS